MKALPVESREQVAAREAQLVTGYCHCWGLVEVVAWEIGTPCSRCGCTWISEAEYRKRLAALTPKRRRHTPMHQRPVATVATGGAL